MRRALNVGADLALWIGSLIVVAPVAAQDGVIDLSPAAAAKELGGTSSRRWVLRSIVRYMSQGGRCTQGEVYRFSATKTVTIDRCVSGALSSTRLPWNIRSGEPDLIVTIGPKNYRARFLRTGSKRQLLLREGAAIKGVENIDMVLTLSRD